MAEAGRREVINDPLAGGSDASSPSRQLGLNGVSNPNQTGGAVTDGNLTKLLGGVQQVLYKQFEKQVDTEVTRGKMAFMAGVTEASLIQNGNRFTERGFETLSAANKANEFYQQELLALENGAQELDPKSYQSGLMQRRAAMLSELPEDPEVRKVYIAAFEDLGPKLAGVHVQANSAWNKGRKINELSLTLASTSDVSTSTPRVPNGGSLAVSQDVVSRPVLYTSSDRDAVVRTMLGEAANQGEVGLAAVAWNIRNRLNAGDWGTNLTSVVKAPLQYSAWNSPGNGGNNLVSKYGPGTPQYERAAKVFDAVMSGRTVDMTGGSTHYFSKSGMKAAGDADGLPSWYAAEKAKAGGEITIGGHTFLGRPTGAAAAVAVAELGPGAPVPAYGTEAKTLLASVTGLRPEEKAGAVASAMAMQLDQGNDGLWNSLGGVAALYELQATPAQITAAYNAHQRFLTEKANKFDLARESEQNDLLAAIANGSVDRTTAEQWVKDKYDQGILNDADATSVLRAAYASMNKDAYSSAPEASPAFMDELAGLYSNMRATPDLGVSDIAPEVTAVASKYGVGQEEVDNILGRMMEIGQQRDAAAATAVGTALKEKAKEDGIKATVKQAIASGGGLNEVTGDVSVPNADGTVSKVPAKQWGIMYLRDQIARDVMAKVQAGQLTQEEAGIALDGQLYSALAKQGVTDTKFGAQVQGAVIGNFMQDGRPNEEALAAYDFYKRMVDNPNVGETYMSEMIADPYARMLLSQAYTLDAGRDDGANALAKAYETMSNPNVDKKYNISADPQFNRLVDDKLNEVMGTALGEGGIGNLFQDVASQVGVGSRTWSNADIEYLKENTGVAKLYLYKQAQASYLQWPQASPEAHLQSAVADLKKNMRVIGGSIVLGQDGRTINDDMGLASAGPDAPQLAVQQWLLQNGGQVWGDLYTELMKRNEIVLQAGPTLAYKDQFGAEREWRPPGVGIAKLDASEAVPPFAVNYNASTKVLELRLWSDETRTTTVGKPIRLDATQLGKEYTESKRKVGLLEGLANSAVGGAADLNKAATTLPEGIPQYSDDPMRQSLYGTEPK